MSYRIVELAPTVQGEGAWAGHPCVLVRFAGCNLWSGREEDRERDALHNEAPCPRWCDTDFRTGARTLGVQQLRDELAAAGAGPDRFVLLTGGEPLLQVDAPLLSAIRSLGAASHVETNGSAPLGECRDRLTWITVSPKVRPSRVAPEYVDELKLVLPAHDPEEWEGFPARLRFVMPLDDEHKARNTEAALAWVQAHPRWKLSLQLHKLLGVR